MNKSKQKGASPVIILMMMCVFAFVVVVGLKIMPHYMTYNTMKSLFQDVLQDKSITDVNAFRGQVGKMMVINNIRDVTFHDLNGYFEEEDGVNYAGFNYEIREHMIANIDVLITFEYEGEQGNQ